jgi:hypothetical protein
LTADILGLNAGGSTGASNLTGLPAFPATFNNAVNGSISGASANFVDGIATATFTAGGSSGAASADAIADHQTITASMTVSANETTDPADQSVCAGATATFSTTFTGPGTPTFVWKKGSTVLNNGDLGGRVSGATTNTLQISNVQASDADTYTVEATGSCNTATQSATLTVQAPTATTDPADVSTCSGGMANFSTTASGTGPFHYAWTLDGSPYNGDSPSISIDTSTLSAGTHTVTVTTTGACGNATQSATLTVGGTPEITLKPGPWKLWPPNHQYSTFNVSDFVASASSTCDPNVDASDVYIVSVSSDEADENPGGADGNTINDIVIAADCKSVQLRAERDGNLDGRVYKVTLKVQDSNGNFTTVTVNVTVPLNHGSTAVDSGPNHTVNSLCP